MSKDQIKKNKELINDMAGFRKEAESEWDRVYPVIKEDFDFYIGNQWDSALKGRLEKEGKPALSLNYIKKNVDVLSGFQRQNRTDSKVLPVEGSDEMMAEVLTTILKWVAQDQISEHVVSDAFKDSLICGIGWVAPIINYDKDVLNGDVLLRKISPFKMKIDPYTTMKDLSDCGYIIIDDMISKPKLRSMFPKFADRIKEMTAVDPSTENSNGIEEYPSVTPRETEKLKFTEYWRREYEETHFASSEETGEIVKLNDAEEFKIASKDENIKVITRKVPVIRLSQVINDEEVVYDGDSPMKVDGYPFHPIFCFFTDVAEGWENKIIGMVRPLKDAQREKNKRRSQIMQAINTMAHSGWIGDKNAVDDISVLKRSSGAGHIIETNPGKNLTQIQPPQISSGLVQLEMMFKDDIMTIGSNPDMLGIMQDKGAAGVTIQLRQKQGMTSIQEAFDNLSFAFRMLNKQILEFILKHWTVDKIKRILGDDLPFDEEKEIITEQIQMLQGQIGQAPEPQIQPIPEGDGDALSPGIEDQLEMAQKQVMEDEDSLAGFQQMQMAQQQQMEDLQKEMQEVLKAEEEFWTKFEEVKKTARFDCIVEESENSPSVRMSNFMLLNEMGRNGTPVPPEFLIELSDLPEKIKENMITSLQEQRQQQPPK